MRGFYAAGPDEEADETSALAPDWN